MVSLGIVKIKWVNVCRMLRAETDLWCLYLPFSWGPRPVLLCPHTQPLLQGQERDSHGKILSAELRAHNTGFKVRQVVWDPDSISYWLPWAACLFSSPSVSQCPHLQNRVRARSGKLIQCVQCPAWWQYLTAVITSTVLQCYAFLWCTLSSQFHDPWGPGMCRNHNSLTSTL